MRKDERDVSEILKFDLFEETVGNWLRSIIKRLEEEDGRNPWSIALRMGQGGANW